MLLRSTILAGLAISASASLPAQKGSQKQSEDTDAIVVTGSTIKTRVIDAADPYVIVEVGKVPMKIRVDFDAPLWLLLLNPKAGDRAKIQSAGPIYSNNSDQNMFSFDGQRVVWRAGYASLKFPGDDKYHRFSRNSEGCRTKVPVLADAVMVRVAVGQTIADGDADGIMGLECLPEERITLRLRAPRENEQTIEVPLSVNPMGFVSTAFKLGRQSIGVRFSPQEPLTVATGGAGALLADARVGRWTGPPTSIGLRFWQEAPTFHPARAITLGRPLSLSGLPLFGYMVRTADELGTLKLPRDESRREEPPPPPDAIVVSGKKIKKRGQPQFQIAVGADMLEDCSSMTYDKFAQTMTFRCTFD